MYGGDGFSTEYVEKQDFDIIKISKKDFEEKYLWEKEELKNLNENIKKSIEEEFNNLKRIRKNYRKNYKMIIDGEIYVPINTQRILKQSHLMKKRTKEDELLSFEKYFKGINKIKNDIQFLKKCNNYILNTVNKYASNYIKDVILSKFSSKICINKEKLTIKQFDWVLNKIIDTFYKAIEEPGTSVGSIAAQSISEPTTQLSISYEENVVYRTNKKDKNGKVVRIGEFIDYAMGNNKDKVILLELTNNNEKSEILNLPEDLCIEVPSMNENGNMEWKQLTQISRHPPNGDLMKIVTESGKEVVSTQSHNFMKYNDKENKYTKVRGDELNIGDELPCVNEDFSEYYKKVAELVQDDIDEMNIIDRFERLYMLN